MMALVWRGFGFPTSEPDTFVIHFYQHVIGKMDGRSCPSYPVCSLYAKQAMTRHGLLMGSWLTLDRLIHESDDLQHARWVRINGRLHSYDPLRRNDFWLKESHDGT